MAGGLAGRLDSRYINAWNVGARVSLFPFGVIHFSRLLNGDLDGAFEVGLEPTFERFNTVRQNFAGVKLELRYYLVRLRYGPARGLLRGPIPPRQGTPLLDMIDSFSVINGRLSTTALLQKNPTGLRRAR